MRRIEIAWRAGGAALLLTVLAACGPDAENTSSASAVTSTPVNPSPASATPGDAAIPATESAAEAEYWRQVEASVAAKRAATEALKSTPIAAPTTPKSTATDSRPKATDATRSGTRRKAPKAPTKNSSTYVLTGADKEFLRRIGGDYGDGWGYSSDFINTGWGYLKWVQVGRDTCRKYEAGGITHDVYLDLLRLGLSEYYAGKVLVGAVLTYCEDYYEMIVEDDPQWNIGEINL